MSNPSSPYTVLVTGGGGYVGSALVPALLKKGYAVNVLDLFIFRPAAAFAWHKDAHVSCFQGDIRDEEAVRRAVLGCDAVIHLAAISNDPSFELNPAWGKSVNYDAFYPLVRAARAAGVKRFVFASSSSVYGIKAETRVTEDLSCEPLTDYSRYKALCETILLNECSSAFAGLVARPATVCGAAPRLRLDLVINLLTAQAYFDKEIRVFGGEQKRPNLHINDMVRFYIQALDVPEAKMNQKVFNVGGENLTVGETAERIQHVLGREDISITKVPTADKRSYAIDSGRLKAAWGWESLFSVEQAILDLKNTFDHGLAPGAPEDPLYSNVKMLKSVFV